MNSSAFKKTSTWKVAADLICLPQAIVNVYLYGVPHVGERSWVLIDAGVWPAESPGYYGVCDE